MLRIVLIIIGCLLFVLGAVQGLPHIPDYGKLTDYGKGYVWGSVLLMVIGLLISVFFLKRKSNKAGI